jgi:exodeoxyribonuclease V alpha subunit
MSEFLIERFDSPHVVTARRLAEMIGIEDDLVIELAAQCIQAAREAHSCVDLAQLALDQFPSLKSSAAATLQREEYLAMVISRLESSHAVRVITDGERLRSSDSVRDLRPLVLLGRLLYTQRQFVDEVSVAEQVGDRLSLNDATCSERARALADLVKPRSDLVLANIENDILCAVENSRFMILTGGPGTGKTTISITAIAVMLMLSERPLTESDVALCAPTGKAASRLKEAIEDFLKDERRSSWINESSREVLSRVQPLTIHRLLGRARGETTRFLHNSESKLSKAIIAIDEASMISAQLMARLLEATPVDSKVMLVGDPGQLESVEAGSVLDQLVKGASGDSSSNFNPSNSHFELKHVWRQGKGSSIPPLANAIRSGDENGSVKILRERREGLEWLELDDPSVDPQFVAGDVVKELQKVMELAQRTDDAAAHRHAIELAGSVKILCGPREGTRGVSFWNSWVMEQLGLSVNDRNTPGRLVLVGQNSPRVGLSNGDIGLVVATAEGPQVAFPGVSELRYLPLSSLPPVETCFAMTIHKSQGSEYKDLVVVILPMHSSPLLNRQLIYTAITRTKNRLRVVGPEASLRDATRNESGRASGLSQLLQRRIQA